MKPATKAAGFIRLLAAPKGRVAWKRYGYARPEHASKASPHIESVHISHASPGVGVPAQGPPTSTLQLASVQQVRSAQQLRQSALSSDPVVAPSLPVAKQVA